MSFKINLHLKFKQNCDGWYRGNETPRATAGTSWWYGEDQLSGTRHFRQCSRRPLIYDVVTAKILPCAVCLLLYIFSSTTSVAQQQCAAVHECSGSIPETGQKVISGYFRLKNSLQQPGVWQLAMLDLVHRRAR